MFQRCALLVVSSAFLMGCGQSSPPGGPGAGDKQPVVGQGENTFKLEVPALETSIKQGESKTISISISRGKNFTQDVLVDFGQIPNGVTLDLPGFAFKGGD